MDTLYTIFLVLLFCLAPAGVLWCCNRSRWLAKTGPVLILYIAGIIVGNLGIMPGQMPAVQNFLSSATIPIAIPLMLFGCRLRMCTARSQVLALVTGIVAVVATVTVGYLLFGRHIDEGAKIGGMLTGVYTGGTINLAALKAMLGVREETYLLINSCDMLVSFLYLTFLLSFGIRFFRRILPSERSEECAEETTDTAVADNAPSPYEGLRTREGMRSAGILLGITLAVCAVSGGIALLLPEGMFMAAFILLLTTLGLACSCIRKVREMKYGYDIGMYLIYIFCITVASMANIGAFDLAGSIRLLGYLTFAVFGSLALQALLAALLRIDADTMVIASVTFINSPPFVPMIAGAMKNRNVIAAGLSIGVIGYAVGNYLGFAIAGVLEKL